jgi:chromosome segregation ATPase
MITLNQMQLLEQKIESAIAKIGALSDENSVLRASCDTVKIENDSLKSENNSLKNENRLLAEKIEAFQANQAKTDQGIISLKNENSSLAAKLGEFQANQAKIEQGIIKALHRLEFVENTIVETARAVSESPVPSARTAAQPDSEIRADAGEEPVEIEAVDDAEEIAEPQIGGPAQQLDIF